MTIVAMLGTLLGVMLSTGAVGGLAWDWWRHPVLQPPLRVGRMLLHERDGAIGTRVVDA